MQRESEKIGVALIEAGHFGAKRTSAVGKSNRSALAVVADVAGELAKAAGQKFECRATTDGREAVTQENVRVVIVSTPTRLSS